MRRGQASLEMTLAMIGALLLLFGSLQVFVWVNGRLIVRQRNYEQTRQQAAESQTLVQWDEPSGSLSVFGETQ